MNASSQSEPPRTERGSGALRIDLRHQGVTDDGDESPDSRYRRGAAAFQKARSLGFSELRLVREATRSER